MLQTETFPISKLLDPVDFGHRWKRARVAALMCFVGPIMDEEEEAKIAEIEPKDHRQLLRAIFENSKKLGKSAKWYFGAEWEASDFRQIISQINSPCFSGNWEEIDEGVALERHGCELVEYCGSFACDYFKEAMQGLVIGLTDEVTYSRHNSFGHGSVNCKDLFVRASAKHLVFGPLPEEIKSILDGVKTELATNGVAIDFPGQCEGVVYYSWRINHGKSCQDLSTLVESEINKALSRIGFDLSIKDITPRAIIGPGHTGKDSSGTPKLLKISGGGKKRWNHILC